MKFITDENIEGERLDVALSLNFPNISRSKIQNLIKNAPSCQVNSRPVKPSYILKLGDIITVDEMITEVTQESLHPENIPLDVVWEDENMAVINKPSGMLTHPTANEMSGTLVNALIYKYGENLSDLNGEMRRGIVHRLDRNTSGLIMVAKNNKTHEFLVNEMKNRCFEKKYLALLKGIVEKDYIEIAYPIGRHPTQPHKMAALTGGGLIPKDAKDSLTILKVLKRFKSATLVELTLISGRTHQIRVHCSAISHPVYNDTLYGFGKMKIKTEEQVLQSYKLDFTKPFTEERISLEIPPDDKINKVLKYLESEVS